MYPLERRSLTSQEATKPPAPVTHTFFFDAEAAVAIFLVSTEFFFFPSAQEYSVFLFRSILFMRGTWRWQWVPMEGRYAPRPCLGFPPGPHFYPYRGSRFLFFAMIQFLRIFVSFYKKNLKKDKNIKKLLLSLIKHL